MKRNFALIFLLIVSCFIVNTGHAQSVVPYSENEQWGYRSIDGEIVIEPRFVLAQEFLAGGIAAVVDNDGWAYIDTLGNVILRPFIFDNGPDYFHQGLARYVDDGKMGFFDETGKIIIPAYYSFANPFYEDRAAVCFGCHKEYLGEHYTMVGGKWGFINRNGEMVIDARYEDVSDFKDGEAQVKLGKWFTIDASGNVLND